jgi:hypothetical protein
MPRVAGFSPAALCISPLPILPGGSGTAAPPAPVAAPAEPGRARLFWDDPADMILPDGSGCTTLTLFVCPPSGSSRQGLQGQAGSKTGVTRTELKWFICCWLASSLRNFCGHEPHPIGLPATCFMCRPGRKLEEKSFTLLARSSKIVTNVDIMHQSADR